MGTFCSLSNQPENLLFKKVFVLQLRLALSAVIFCASSSFLHMTKNVLHLWLFAEAEVVRKSVCYLTQAQSLTALGFPRITKGGQVPAHQILACFALIIVLLSNQVKDLCPETFLWPEKEPLEPFLQAF